jgi:head-tail adaptor
MSLAPLFGGMNVIATAFLEASPFRCQVLRQTLTDDSRGGKTETFAPVSDDLIPCLYAPFSGISGNSQVMGGMTTASSQYQITLPSGTGVMAKDRIKILAHGDESERVFEIDHLLRASGIVIEAIGVLRG